MTHQGDGFESQDASARPGRQIVVFSRSPRDEARAKGLPLRGAERLFTALLRTWARVARGSGARLVVSSPSCHDRRFQRLVARCEATLDAQVESSFDERVRACLDRAHSSCPGALLLVAGDCPAPRTEGIDETFGWLEQEPARLHVIPALDGGVNVVGLARAEPELWRDIPWRSADVTEVLCRRSAELGLESRLAPPTADLDSLIDAASLCGRLALAPVSGESWSLPRLRSLLEEMVRPVRHDRSSDSRIAGTLHPRAARARGPPAASLPA